MSLPTWKCGLKRDSLRVSEKFGKVTSYLEVWIETDMEYTRCQKAEVTSYLEVWIETIHDMCLAVSLPVTSYLEVWIETLLFGIFIPRHQSHFLLGSVD